MKNPALPRLALALGLACASVPALAQDAIVLDPALTGKVLEALADAPIRHYVGEDTGIHLDVLAGSPTGVRLGIPSIYFSESVRLAFEGIYGAGITPAGVTQLAGGGLRVDINAAQSFGGSDALFVSPGVDVFFAWDGGKIAGYFDQSEPQGTVYLLSASADAAWVHEFARHFGFHLGMRVGAAISLGGKDSSGKPTGGRIVPEASLFTGVRF